MNIDVEDVKINGDSINIISGGSINKRDYGIILAETNKARNDIIKVSIETKDKSGKPFTDEIYRIE